MISIIVPVYNAEAYIDECIKSILAQTYQDFELILVNDGSKDKSLELCRKYESAKVKLIDKPNGGVSSARNMGIRASKGDYLVFVDSDDTLPVSALQSLFDNSEDEIDSVVGSFNYQYEKKVIPHRHNLYPKVYKYSELIPDFIDNGKLAGFLISSSCGTLYRASIIKTAGLFFNEDLKINEDGLFNLEFALHANKIKKIDEIVYVARKHDDSSSHTQFSKKDFNSTLYAYLKKYQSVWELYDFELQFQRRNVTIVLWEILLNVKLMDLKTGLVYLRNILSSKQLKDSLWSIRAKELPWHKKLMFILIKGNYAFSLFLVAKYIIPFLSSKIAR